MERLIRNETLVEYIVNHNGLDRSPSDIIPELFCCAFGASTASLIKQSVHYLVTVDFTYSQGLNSATPDSSLSGSEIGDLG